jgi:hypothetical protein
LNPRPRHYENCDAPESASPVATLTPEPRHAALVGRTVASAKGGAKRGPMRRVFRENRRDTCADPRIRLNREGVVLARGKLDYDRPIARRCAACGAVIETTLADLHAPCPACGRYPEAVA